LEKLTGLGEQSASGPTHNDGHTLDVVITRTDLPQSTVTVRPSGEYSDNSLVLFQLPLPRPALRHVDFSTRAWKTFDEDRFRTDLLNSQLFTLPNELDSASVDWLQDVYDNTLSSLLDKHAARRTVRRRHQPTTPWFDSELLLLLTDESGPRKSGRSSDCTQPSRIAIGKPRSLTATANLSAVLRREKLKPTVAVGLDAESFSVAFAVKVDGVRQSTAAADLPCFTDLNSECRFSAFEPVDAATVQPLTRTVSEIRRRHGL